MSGAFSDNSLQICQDFLQTAVVIDDRALKESTHRAPVVIAPPGRGRQPTVDLPRVSPEQERGLDTTRLIKSFAKLGIVCSALRFTTFDEDAEAFEMTAKSADIAVVDWEMEVEKTGENALNLISSLLEDDLARPKRFRLISIYTGAEDLERISNAVISHIRDTHNVELKVDQNGLRLSSQSIVITIYAKDTHGIPEHYHCNAVDEGGLPERLVSCFSEAISGLLPNTVLSALTAVRQSTHHLLARFNKDLDYAYLTHRASLERPEDAASHLEELIAEEIKSILSSYDCIGSNASFSVVEKWVKEHYKNMHEFVTDGIKLSRDEILSCLRVGTEEAETSLGKAKQRKLYGQFSTLLAGNEEVSSFCDVKLARLSVLKTRYQKTPPHLTMGVILQEPRDKSLWLCIQPKCDSVRLKDRPTKFPLLPISPGKAKRSVLPKLLETEVEKFYAVQIHPKNCRSVEFKSAQKDGSRICPRKYKDRWLFLTTTKGLRFEFIVELKDEIAQDIMNEFAATTARVGTNPSEWLRKSGKK